MKIKSIIIIMFYLLTATISGEIISQLPSLAKPRAMVIHKNKIYITEKFSIKIFDKKSGKFLKEFGKRGEGPGEFKFMPNLVIHGDKLLLTSPANKVYFFSLEGDYIGEKKIRYPNTGPLPVAGNFAGRIRKYISKELRYDQNIVVFNESFKLKKSLYIAPWPGSDFIVLRGNKKQDYKFVDDCIGYQVSKDKIIIGDTRNKSCLKVYDKNGEFLYDIKLEESPIKINANYLKRFNEEWKHNQTFTPVFKDKINLVFPEYIPAFRHFKVNNDRIYLQTYFKKGGSYNFIILDINGKKIGTKYLPVVYYNNFPLNTFNEDYYYYLMENEEEDNWELNKIKIF